MIRLELKNRKNQKIVGDLEKPADAVGCTIRGTCIIEHGWGGNRKKTTVQAIKAGFLAAGFQTFNFDATNSFGESDGDFEQSTLMTFSEDLEDVVRWAEKQDWFIKPLALSGHSKGGYSIARFAEKYPDEVGYLVPVAPVVSGKLSFEAYERKDSEGLKKWKKEGVIVQKGREGNTKIQHWHQMEERLNHDLLPTAKKLSMPTLLIVGSKDESCPPDHVRILFDAIPEGKKSMEIIEGVPHSFYLQEEQKTCQRFIRQWLDQYVCYTK